MVNSGVLYRVTGRYMDGQNLVGYHLTGEDNSQTRESKDRVLWLIGRGIITNLRVQSGTNGEVIIRGKGVNLNNLPVYDINKDKFRGDPSASSNRKYVSNAALMGQYTIIKRIMSKNNCLGYEIQDSTGASKRLKRGEVIELANKRLISNAMVQKYRKDSQDTPKLILRGTDGCDLSKLPVLIVDANGNIIDPTLSKNKLSVRAVYMKHGGILRNTINNTNNTFKSGDYLVYNASGDIDILSSQEIKEKYTRDTSTDHAICDDYLSFAANYYIEIFGGKLTRLNENIIKNWVILKKI